MKTLRSVVGAVLALCGCVSPRQQILLYVQTDLPEPLSQFGDTLRVERLDSVTGVVIETRDIAASSRSQWPISLGVLPGPAGQTVRIRLRLFPSSAIVIPAVQGYEGGVAPTPNGQPRWGLTIDRLVDLSFSSFEGLRRVEVLMSGQCYSNPANVLEGKTCLPTDELDAQTDGSATLGQRIVSSPPVESRIGTWQRYREATRVPVPVEPRIADAPGTGESFVQGGFFFLGDERQSLVECEPRCWPVPERAALISSFYVDRYEVTVGRWRAALAQGFAPNGRWFRSETSNLCMFSDDPRRALRPMNCVSWAAAEQFCRFDGARRLITEAQWEYLATGGGLENAHPWGNDVPLCDRAVYARIGRFNEPFALGTRTECHYLNSANSMINEPEEVTSEQQDRSVIGVPRVVGLAGNVQEWNRDVTHYYFGPAYGRALLVDPAPRGEFFEPHSVRGASYGHTSIRTYVTLRDGRDDEWVDPNNFPRGTSRNGEGWQGPAIGFRCARSIGSPP